MSSKQTILIASCSRRHFATWGEEDLLLPQPDGGRALEPAGPGQEHGELAQFAEGDLVQFMTTDGSVKHGVVNAWNKKTASVRTDEGQN